MGQSLRRLSRVLLLACVCVAGGLVPGSGSTTAAQESDAVTAFPEVRLRKLHLVRPDLIPYPIAYEVVC